MANAVQSQKTKKLAALGVSFAATYFAFMLVSTPIIIVATLVLAKILVEMQLGPFLATLLLNGIVMGVPLGLIIYKYRQIMNRDITSLVTEELSTDGDIIVIDTDSVAEDATSEKIRSAFLKAKEKLGFHKTDVLLIRLSDDVFNAYALSNSKQEAAIVVYDGLADNVSEEHLQAVIGHEIGHIMNRDSQLKMALYASQYYIPSAVYYADTLNIKVHNFLASFKNAFVTLISMIWVLTYRIMITLVNLGMWVVHAVTAFGNKQSEYIADHSGANASSRESMIGVLELIDSLEQRQEKTTVRSALLQVLAEHPKTQNRIDNLRSH